MSLKRVVNLDNVVELPQKQKEADLTRIASVRVAVPPNELFGMNLKKIDGFRDIRVDIKQNNELQEFVDGFDGVLQYFNMNDKHFDSMVVKFVAQSAEWFFVRKKSGDLKEKAVIAVCAPFFNNDPELVKTIIQLVLPTIKKCNVYRRYKKKLFNGLSFFLKLVGCSYHPSPQTN